MGRAVEHEGDDEAWASLRADNDELRRRNHSLEIVCDRFRALYEQTPTPHVTIAPDRVIVDLNDAAAALLGAPRERLLATPFDGLVAPPGRDRFVALVDVLFASGRARSGEVVLVRPGTTPLEASFDGVVLAAAPGEPPRAVLAIVDLTARRAVDAARRKAQDEVLAIVSHDLRGPISAIGLACDGLATDASVEERQECVAAIRRSVARSERLIEDLVRVAHLESGRLELEWARFDVRNLVEQVRRDHERAAATTRAQLTVTLGPQPAFVRGDRDRLHQVLSNLVGNALVHARGAAVEISVAGRADRILITVADRGPGIAADTLPFVFERYRQGPRRRGGAGLGLAIVKGLVLAHQGTVSVDSQLGVGTRFTITLPRAPADESPTPAGALAG